MHGPKYRQLQLRTNENRPEANFDFTAASANQFRSSLLRRGYLYCRPPIANQVKIQTLILEEILIRRPDPAKQFWTTQRSKSCKTFNWKLDGEVTKVLIARVKGNNHNATITIYQVYDALCSAQASLFLIPKALLELKRMTI